MMNERKKNGYRYFYGGCIGILLFLLVFTFNYIGIEYVWKIIFTLMIILYVSWRIKKKSDKLTEYYNTRSFFRTSGKLQIPQGEENMEIPTYFEIFRQRFVLCVILFALYFPVGYIIGYLPIFFHELGHLLTALSFNIEIVEVFLSPLYGYVKPNGEIPNTEFIIIALSGGLGVIVSGTILLFILHWNDDISLTIYIPLYSIIYYVVWDNLKYLWDGAFLLPNNYDIGLIVQKIPNFNIYPILYISLFWMTSIIIFSCWSIMKRVYVKTKAYLNAILPDFSLFDSKH